MPIYRPIDEYYLPTTNVQWLPISTHTNNKNKPVVRWVPIDNKESFFSRCERDAKGHCMSAGDLIDKIKEGKGKKVTAKEAKSLAESLSRLSTKELATLKKEHGLKATGKEAELVEKLAQALREKIDTEKKGGGKEAKGKASGKPAPSDKPTASGKEAAAYTKAMKEGNKEGLDKTLGKMTVAKLNELAKANGVTVSGLKGDKVKQLVDAVKSKDDKKEATKEQPKAATAQTKPTESPKTTEPAKEWKPVETAKSAEAKPTVTPAAQPKASEPEQKWTPWEKADKWAKGSFTNKEDYDKEMKKKSDEFEAIQRKRKDDEERMKQEAEKNAIEYRRKDAEAEQKDKIAREKKLTDPNLKKDALSKMKGPLSSNKSLSPEQKQAYGKAIDDATANMPPKALERLTQGLKGGAVFHDSSVNLTRSVYGDDKANSMLARGEIVGGVYRGGQSIIELNGMQRGDSGGIFKDNDSSNIHEAYAHEMAHAIDFGKQVARADNGGIVKGDTRYSASPEWQKAMNAEIMTKDNRLGKYAKTDEQEAFAEFGRAVYGRKVPKDKLEKMFPMCSAFWKKEGLWPN